MPAQKVSSLAVMEKHSKPLGDIKLILWDEEILHYGATEMAW